MTTLALVAAVFAFRPIAANAAQTNVRLGTAANFAVLAGQGVTNVNNVGTVLNGNLGTSPNPAVTGFPPGIVNGAIHRANGVALQAKQDLTRAYNDAAGGLPVHRIATELGGKSLAPGVYDSASGTFHITGTLTLNAHGDPNAVFIFQMQSTLITASSSDVNLLGGARACNSYWQVGSSATLGTNSNFTGNILALTSIQAQTGADIQGRLLARNASVTLDTNTITAPACGTVATPPGSGGPGSGGPGSGGPGSGGPGSGPTATSTSTSTPQVVRVPKGGPQTGGGSTAGLHNLGFLALGGALLAAAGGTFAMRRRAIRNG